MCGTLTYASWAAMMTRCRNKKNKDYGGKGIQVCERWKTFANFYADMGERPSKSHSIDRKKNNKGYDPKNCKWSTKIEQGNNHSLNRRMRYRGEIMTISQARRASGMVVAKSTVTTRLNKLKWPLQKALETPAVMGRNQWK